MCASSIMPTRCQVEFFYHTKQTKPSLYYNNIRIVSTILISVCPNTLICLYRLQFLYMILTTTLLIIYTFENTTQLFTYMMKVVVLYLVSFTMYVSAFRITIPEYNKNIISLRYVLLCFSFPTH